MLLRWIGLLGLTISIGAVAAAGLVHAAPPASTQGALFGDACPPAASPDPCWIGVIPGQTDRQEARDLLENHVWIGQVFETAQSLSWHWSGAQPPQFDGRYDGLLRIEGDRVTQIRLPLNLTMGQLWSDLGLPTRARLVRPVSLSAMYQITYYDAAGVYFTNTLSCPVARDSFWAEPVTMGMGDIWLTETINGAELPIYSQPGWWNRLNHYCPG